MWSEYLSFIDPMISAFNPEQVFASVTNFLGSGYVGIAVIALVALSVVKKVVKLVGMAAVVGIIWLACTTGVADQIIAQIQGLLP